MAVYDSAKVRGIAEKMHRISIEMDAEVRSSVRGASEGLEPLHGRTAQAMGNRLSELCSQAEQLAMEIEAVARFTNAYAEALERVDQELANRL